MESRAPHTGKTADNDSETRVIFFRHWERRLQPAEKSALHKVGSIVGCGA
jgi:hypothetical protein